MKNRCELHVIAYTEQVLESVAKVFANISLNSSLLFKYNTCFKSIFFGILLQNSLTRSRLSVVSKLEVLCFFYLYVESCVRVAVIT